MQIKQHFLKKLAADGKGRGARAERKRGTDREGSPGQPVYGGISPRKKIKNISSERLLQLFIIFERHSFRL